MAIDKLNQAVVDGDVVLAAHMNNATSKTDEVVEQTNTNTSEIETAREGEASLYDNIQVIKESIGTSSGINDGLVSDYSTWSSEKIEEVVYDDVADKVGMVQLIASGALTDGKPVVLNTDGTVAEVDIAESIISELTGTEKEMSNAVAGNQSIAIDPFDNSQFLYVFGDPNNSYYGTAILCSIDESLNITLGTSYVFVSAAVGSLQVDFDKNTQNKFVIGYSNSGAYVVCGTNSSGTLSFGTPLNHATASPSTATHRLRYDPNNADKFAIAWNVTSVGGAVTIFTISGTTITEGGTDLFETHSISYVDMAWDLNTADKLFVGYHDSSGTNYIQAVAVSISGTTPTAGTPILANSVADGSYVSVCTVAGETDKLLIVFRGGSGASYVARYNAISVSGTTLTTGTPTDFETNNISYLCLVAMPSDDHKFGLFYRDFTDSTTLKSRYGDMTSGTVTFNTAVDLDTPISGAFQIVGAESGGIIAIPYYDSSSRSNSLAIVHRFPVSALSTNLESYNFLGFAHGDFSDTDTAKILTSGSTSAAQSGLTPKTVYYVQNDGTLDTSADSPSVVAGTALTASKLLIKETL